MKLNIFIIHTNLFSGQQKVEEEIMFFDKDRLDFQN